jgi:rhodanese-related sulfurtransferase
MIKAITSIDAYNLIEILDNAFLIDVRTENEWKQSGIPNIKNSISVTYDPYNELEFIDLIEKNIENKETDIFFICRSGVRSFNAATLMEFKGYKNCYNIEDGFEGSKAGLGWVKNNLPHIYKI